MEKRFLFALMLSVCVMLTWSLFQKPPLPPPDAGGPAGPDSGPAVESPGEQQQPGVEPVVEALEPQVLPETPFEVRAAEGEESLEILVGQPGQPGYYRAVFSNRGGRLVELRFGDFFVEGTPVEERGEVENWLTLVQPVELGEGRQAGSLLWTTRPSSEQLTLRPLDEVLWEMDVERDGAGHLVELTFTYGPGTGVVFTKRLRPVPDSWDLALTLEIENLGSAESGVCEFLFVPAGCVPAELDDAWSAEPHAVAVGRAGDDDLELDQAHGRAEKRGDYGSLDVPGPLAFGGAHNKYFAFLMRGDAARNPESVLTLAGAGYRQIFDAGWAAENPLVDPSKGPGYAQTELNLSLSLPPVGGRSAWEYLIYAGPKQRGTLQAADPAFARLVESDLGFFSGIGNILLSIMGIFHSLTSNWGVAIILLTLLVRAILFPLNRRSQTAMARYQTKMKRVQPKIDEVKKKYANDPQKLRQEQGRIMQEEGAFPPLGGCLPPFLQLPVFFGLYMMLRNTFDLRQEPFYGWITDLSQPDRMFHMGLELPFLPSLEYFNLLPILMVLSWVFQQRGMPKPADEQAARMQKMMTFMPIVMGVFLYNYAAGLSLYMITQSSLGIVEQRIIKKVWPVDDTEVEKKKKGCGPFSGFMEKIAEQQKEQMKRAQEQQRKQQGQKKKRKKR